jgi:hypothetical protein
VTHAANAVMRGLDPRSSLSVVMPGLDPGIHLLRKILCLMDCRVKPGNDAFICEYDAMERSPLSQNR